VRRCWVPVDALSAREWRRVLMDVWLGLFAGPERARA
jgi:hypothetical protein